MNEGPATRNWPASSESAPRALPTIPGYEVLAELGRGGMGVVYRARQTNPQREVALKLIRDGALASPQERGRFRIEAEAAARMRHPNVVQMYEVGEHGELPYFAMELVEGGGLDKQLTGRPQPARQAALLLRILAQAIQHAHAQKIVHRDLKPANILMSGELRVGSEELVSGCDRRPPLPIPNSGLLSPNSQLLTPKITDFGLAKRLDSESTAWTQDGVILGTASYMAPEQAAGRVRDVGPAVDIYALGAILYELLTGRPPFLGDSFHQTVQQVIHDEPVAPSRLHAGVPGDLETICLQCLEKDPGRRYATALELADDLGRFLDARPVAAVRLSGQERLARLARRSGYEMLREIGRGPRSVVYHALVEPLKQPVALKVFHEGVTQEEWDSRIQRATDMWTTLAHPHIVPMRQAGWWDGVAFVAVEYVPQGSLASKLAGKPFPLPQALRLVEQLTETVSYLHRQGVVHGNLKPSNILLAADGIPRLVDFRLTAGLFVGPPTAGESAGLKYLTPELAEDLQAEPRFYTDIYGLGLILYELLTGQSPFAGRDPSDIRQLVRTQEPVPPSRLNAKVTPQLDAVCLRCLHKNPWRRYHRAHDLLTGLQYLRTASSPTIPRKQRSKPRPQP